MSAIAGVFGPAAQSSAAALSDMLAAMKSRAEGTPELFHSSGAHVVAARHDWEEKAGGWSGPLVAENEEWVVAADAALYYVADLRRKLRARASVNSAQLLLLALRQWGPRFADHIEGDYSIIAFERRRNRVLLARDFGGRRNLAYSVRGRTLVVATSPVGVVRHPEVSGDYDATFITLSAAGVEAHGTRTAFRHVAFVGGGSTLSFEDGRITEVHRWSPPAFGSGWDSELSASAAEELRAAIEAATRERMAPTGPSTIWMSGGWDSTSVFASGRSSLLRDNHGGQRLLPVSMTYQAGDLGNEETHIRAVAELWDAPVRWIDAEQIPLFGGEERAQVRDDPMPQPFESQVRAMAQVTRELGSRVALDGFGGDHIFDVSSASIVADHLFYGRWSQLWESFRRWGASNREFVRSCVLLHLTPGSLEWIGAIRGRPLRGYWDRTVPMWILASQDVLRELSPELERLPGEGAAEYTSRLGIHDSLIPRALSWNHLFGLDEGIHVRSPLFDNRVIALSAPRPLSDRGGGGDSKRLLRRAMTGILPDSVLAPRNRKTGTPVGYFNRQLSASLTAEVDIYFRDRQSNLERLGLLNRSLLESAVEEYSRSGLHGLGAILHRTLETERWLASRS